MTSTVKVALVTGAAKRLGAASVLALHTAGNNVIVHCHRSIAEAEHLVERLNSVRPDSARFVCTELGNQAQAQWLVERSLSEWGRLDTVVNNASSFSATPIDSVTENAVKDLMSSNLFAPLFISQSAAPSLAISGGSIVNMVDIHGLHPLHEHSVYCAAKAALIMLTRSLAKELAPEIRVNAIAPGAILWPEDGSLSSEDIDKKLSEIPLKRCGSPEDIANLVVYLSCEKASFITGEIIKVDGGRAS